ncbi:hypothetical protein ACN6K6_000615 [Streptomyces violaceoruber]|uniref:hypothetical protein n=1 Tax=Streptomyces violaceoruber TaxID=1935 RepID=UPI00403C6973
MAQDVNHHRAPSPDYRPFLDLSDSGLLWLINRVVFHPRGVALALYQEGDAALGWTLLTAAKGEPFTFYEAVDLQGFQRAEATLRTAFDKGDDDG